MFPQPSFSFTQLYQLLYKILIQEKYWTNIKFTYHSFFYLFPKNSLSIRFHSKVWWRAWLRRVRFYRVWSGYNMTFARCYFILLPVHYVIVLLLTIFTTTLWGRTAVIPIVPIVRMWLWNFKKFSKSFILLNNKLGAVCQTFLLQKASRWIKI